MAEARSYAMRNRQGSDWFGHEDSGAKPSPQQATPVKNTPNRNGVEADSAGRTQMIKPTTNSNNWYKYDQQDGGKETPQSTKATTTPVRQASGDWYAHSTPKSGERAESKARAVTTEGEQNCRRDKSGSSATWFSHEHADESGQPGVAARITTKEGSNNASRMRGESENWFSHEAKGAGVQAAPHVSKGRGLRTQSNEMHQIFHMDNAGK